MITLPQAKTKLINAGFDFHSDGKGGGWDILQNGLPAGRVYSDAGLITFAERLPVQSDAPALSAEMQSIAHDYLAARTRAGAALLDQARYLAAARDTAKHGEWGVFLEATQTSEDWAGRLLNIHDTAETDAAFAAAIRSNFLNLSTAYELASAPVDLRKQLLAGDTPPTVKTVRDEKRAANSATSRNLEVPTIPKLVADPVVETEIKRLCAICGARYLGLALDRGVPDGTRYRIFYGAPPRQGGGDYLADEALTKLHELCDAKQAAALIVGQRADPTKPDPREPPAPVFEEDEPTPASDSAAYKIIEQQDRRWLEDAEMAIGGGAFAYARQLLGRVQKLTYTRDTILERIIAQERATIEAQITMPAAAAPGEQACWWNCGIPLRAIEHAVNHHDRAGALAAARELVKLFEE